MKISDSPTTCKECGSPHLTWYSDVKNYGNAVDGRLRLSEIGAIFYLGCDDCSETLRVIEGVWLAAELKDLIKH